MPSVSEILKEASAILQKSEVAEPRREATSLLGFALGKNKTFLIAHSEYELSFEEEKRFRDFVTRRARREPFQYIVGRQEFCGLDFAVTKDVLIPRPETEMIVEAAMEILRTRENSRFCEVGIGSGCIAVSILHSVETTRAIGLDISEKALAVARANAETHRVSARLELQISDVFANLPNEKFDLIVSNPPYISETDLEDLQAEVKNFEPHSALFARKDGLEIVEKIIDKSPQFLKKGGFLLTEIGIRQSETVKKMLSTDIWKSVEFINDLQEIPRTLKAQII